MGEIEATTHQILAIMVTQVLNMADGARSKVLGYMQSRVECAQGPCCGLTWKL